jgi:predicted chitinase
MYFDLQNVPFFNGAYLITSVSHSISPNQMSTNFEGVRQSKYITSPSKQITADLDIDLNESSETPKIEFTNLNNKNPIYSIGVLNPNDSFNFTANFTVDKFKLLGVTQFTDEDLGKFLNQFRVSLLTANIKTNSQVSMFISSVLTNSNNLLNTQMPWDIENKETYENKFPNTDLLNPGKTIYYDDTITSNTYLYSLPVFSAGSIDDISYNIPGNDKLKEFTINNNIENRKLEIDKKISSLNVNVPSEKLEIDKLKKEKNKLIEQEENLTGTTKYYNIFEGDAYRFRPRGYLYVIGRKQYTDLFGDLGQTTPSYASIFPELTSIKVWQYLKDNTGKTAYQYSSTGNGSATIFSKCVEISQQYPNYKLEESFSTFEKVLNIFVDNNNQPLINYFNPGP